MSIADKTLGTWWGRVPVSFFSMSMGYAGLAAAWREASRIYGVPVLIADGLMILGLMMFGALVFGQMRRWQSHTDVLAAEFEDPIKGAFFATFSMSLLSLAGSVLVHSPMAASVMWGVGAATHLVIAVAIISRWFERDCDVANVNPGWFLPSAGNLLVPVTGAQLGFVELSWFFFAVGFVFWAILFVILIYRVIFLGPFRTDLMPTLFVFLAPPSLAALALEALTGQMASPVGAVLIYTSVFFAVLLATLWRQFQKTGFAPIWWASTFPTAAMATACLRYGEEVSVMGAQLAGILALGFSTTAVGVLSILTVMAARNGTLFVAPHPSPAGET